jgi:uncharacterized protein YkwD
MNAINAILALALVAFVNAPEAASSKADPYAAQLGKLINDYRTHNGLQPLVLVAPLSELAQKHAAHMAQEDRLSHEGFQQRFVAARSPHCVENVGWNTGTPQAEFEAWQHSPAHDHNLLDAGITRMGIAIEGRYVAFFACR